MIVLAGSAAIEKAAGDAGRSIEVPFTPGRTDAAQDETDADSFAVLEPAADGFRNYFGNGNRRSPTDLLVDRASMLTLTVPEMTALVGGMRALNANAGSAGHGVFTDRPGTLTNDFFVNLLDMSTAWTKSESDTGVYEGRDRASGDIKWTATPVDLVFGSHSELRAVAEIYAADDGAGKFRLRLCRSLDKGDEPRPVRRAVKPTAGRPEREQAGRLPIAVSRRRPAQLRTMNRGFPYQSETRRARNAEWKEQRRISGKSSHAGLPFRRVKLVR